MGASETLRDALFGSPPRPDTKPSRSGVLAAFRELERVANVSATGMKVFTTVAEMNAYTPVDDDQRVAVVIKDPTSSNNTVYRYVGTTWEVFTEYYFGVMAVASDVLDEIIAARDEALNVRGDVWHFFQLAAIAANDAGHSRDEAAQIAASIPAMHQQFVNESERYAELSESYASGLAIIAAGYIYASLADGAADPDIEDGQSFLVADGSGRIYFGHKVDGVGVLGAEFVTAALFKEHLFTQLSGRNIPASILTVRSRGFSVSGLGAATYAYDPSLDEDYVDEYPLSSFLDASGRVFRIAEDVIDAKMLGARQGYYSTPAIEETGKITHSRGGGEATLLMEGDYDDPYWIDGEGKTNPFAPDDLYQRGVLCSYPNVHFRSDGATLKIVGTHEKNPPGIFGHHYWRFENLHNVGFTGTWILDGNMYDAERNPDGVPSDNGFQNGAFNEADVYQSQIGILCYKSSGTVKLGNIIGQNIRGDVVSLGIFGDADGYVDNVLMDSLICKEIFREGIGLFNIHGGDIEYIKGSGNGYWVALVDVERHLMVDTVRNLRIGTIEADFRTGRSPEERTPNILDPAERELARRTMRRIVSCMHQYDGFEDDEFDFKSMNISIDRVIGIQACMDNFNFASVRYGYVELRAPFDEDLTGHMLIDENDGSCDAFRCQAITFVGGNVQWPTGLYGVSFAHPPYIEGHYAHGMWFSNFSDIYVPDGTVIKGTKKAPLRCDTTSGVIGRVITTDCGTTEAPVYAVDVFGSGAGTLYIDGVVAQDTRSGVNRTMQGCVRINGAEADKIDITNCRNDNTIGTVVVTNLDPATVAYGNVDKRNPVFDLKMPLSTPQINGDLVIIGDVTIGDGTNDANITVKAGTGDSAKISFLVGTTLQYQITQTGDGSLLFNQFDGNYIRNDIYIPESGGIILPSATYQNPLVIKESFLWVDSNGTLYVKNSSAPTSETDGTPVV